MVRRDPVTDTEKDMIPRDFWYHVFDIAEKKEVPENYDNFDILDNFIAREYYVTSIGYPLLMHQWIRELAEYLKGKKVLEVMCGSGLLAYILKNTYGIDITATDSNDWNKNVIEYDDFEIIECDAEKAIEKFDFDIVLMCWPPYESDIAYKVIKKMRYKKPGKKLLMLGENYGGCTADDDFFDFAKPIQDKKIEKINRKYVSWGGLYDQFYLYE